MARETTFSFFNEDLDEYVGTYVQRADAMTLDIPAQDSCPPYLIIGNLRNGLFTGENNSRLPGAPAITAKWTRIDNRCVGTWRENELDYVFWFDLDG